MERHILHLHIPCFQISLERVADPKLRYRPVVVAVPPDGGIISCSLEAKREGIRPGMSIREAKSLCPRVIFIRPDPMKVEKGLERLHLLAQRYTPLWEISKAGHLYLDLTGTHRLWDIRDVGQRLIVEIKEDLGVPCSTGIGANKLVSQIASRIVPPLELLEVRRGEEGHFMAPLDISFIPAIYPKEAHMLKTELGIQRVGLLWGLDFSLLRLLFSLRAPVVYDQSRGIDHSPVYPHHKIPKIEESITFPGDINEDEVLRSYLFVLLERCLDKIQKIGLLPKRGGLWFRYSDYMCVMRAFWPKGRELWPLFRELEGLFKKGHTRKTGVRELGLWLSCTPRPPIKKRIQELWEEKGHLRSWGLSKAINEVRERFGRDAIFYGIALGVKD